MTTCLLCKKPLDELEGIGMVVDNENIVVCSKCFIDGLDEETKKAARVVSDHLMNKANR